ncbi:MAG: sigma-70 family RNA polymerase sigma factor [Planctomycetota bacterium]
MNRPIRPEALLEHRDFIRSLARSLVRDEHRAEDIVQQTWLTALQRPPRKAASLRAWLAQVARHAAFNMQRGERRRQHREVRSAKLEAGMPTDEIVARLSVHRELVDAVLALEEPYRKTILLRFYEDLTPTQIAERTNVPLETVRSRLRRGLQRLRERLDPGGAEDRRVLALGLLALSEPPMNVSFPMNALLKGVLAMKAQMKVAAGVVVLIGLTWVTLSSFSVDEPPRSTSEVSDLVVPEKDVSDEVEVTESETVSTAAPEEELTEPPPVIERAELGELIARCFAGEARAPEGWQVTLYPPGAASLLEAVVSTTDASGEAHFEDLSPGSYVAAVDRGVSEPAIVAAGDQAVVDLRVVDGLTVRGRVVDAFGRGVEGAEIWLSEPQSNRSIGPRSARQKRSLRWKHEHGALMKMRRSADPDGPLLMIQQEDPGHRLLHGAVIGLSGPGGELELEGVPVGRYLGARALHHEPSMLYPVVRAGDGRATQLEIVLPRAGGAIEGRVIDPAGEPVLGAIVQAGDPDGGVAYEASGRYVPGVRPYRTTTDEEGAFRVPGLEAGSSPISVRAAGYATWADRVVIEASQTLELTITLQSGGRLEGTVFGEDGAPVAGARVEVIDFESAFLITDSEGRFQFDALPEGRARLVADHVSLGIATAEPYIATGRTTQQDLTLDRGRALSGRVVDARGEPHAGWLVRASRFDVTHETTTDAAGHFRLVNVPEDSESIGTKKDDPSILWTFATWVDVPLGSSEVTIVVPDAEPASAWIEGRVVAPPGEALGPATLRLTLIGGRDAIAFLREVDAETGRFRVGPFAAGELRGRIESERYGSKTLEPMTLVPERTLDLGDIPLQLPGRLVVASDWNEGVQEAALLEVVDPSGGRVQGVEVSRRSDATTVISLQPGPFVLRVSGGDVETVEVPFEIRSGEDSRLEVSMRPAIPVVLTFLDPEVGDVVMTAELLIRDEAGRRVVGGEITRFDRATPLQFVAGLRPGTYAAWALAPSGLRAAGRFTVTAQTKSRDRIEIPFR